MMPKMIKEEYFRKRSINPESRIKQEKQESMKSNKVQKIRKVRKRGKRRKAKAKQSKKSMFTHGRPILTGHQAK